MTKGKDDPAADPKDDIDDLDERSEREVRRDRRMEQLQKSIKQRRWQLWGNIGIAAGLIIVIGGVVYNFREVIFQEENIVIAIFIGIILFPFILKILYTGKTDTTSFQADYDRLELEKEISDRKKSLQQLSVEQFSAPVQPSGEETEGEPASKTISYFDDLVQTNIVNLREYYLLVRVHTNNSFRFSQALSDLSSS